MSIEQTDESMGCCSSNVIQPTGTEGNGLTKDSAPKDPPISNRDAEIIQSNWKVIEQDLQGYGIALFKRLFEQNPDIKDKFYFAVENNGDMESIMADGRLAKHAKGVMDTISVAIAMVHNLSCIVPVLKQLGAAHARFDLKPKHFQAVGDALLWTLESAVGDKFDVQARKSWIALYKVVTSTMMKGSEDVKKAQESS